MTVCFEVRPWLVPVFPRKLTFNDIKLHLIRVIADIENPEINGNEMNSLPSIPSS